VTIVSQIVIPECLYRGSKSLKVLMLLAGVWIPTFAGMTVAEAFFVDNGETGFEFLKIPTAARAIALGDSFTAMSGDSAVMEYNPAALRGLEQLDINVSHQEYFEDSTLDSVMAAYPFAVPFFGRAKTSVNGNDTGNLTVGAQYKQFKADDDTRDAVGINLGEFLVRDQLFQMSFAVDVSYVDLGFSGKYIKNRLGDEDRTNMAFDMGALFHATDRLSFGASMLNMGPSKAFIEEKEPLPTTLRLGTAYSWKKWNFVGDLVQTRDKQTHPSAGAEWSPVRALTLRVGGRYTTDVEISGGLGFKMVDLGAAPATQEAPKVAQPAKKDNRKTLGDTRTNSAAPSSTIGGGGITIGLDYAIRSHNVLGAVHTLTLRILY